MINIFEGRISEHKGRTRPKKAFIEKMVRHVDFNRYIGINREN